MVEAIKTFIKRIKCHHDYEYQKTLYKRKVSQSSQPFWYTEIYIHLKCMKCEKEIAETYDSCIANDLPTHKPLNIRRKGKRN